MSAFSDAAWARDGSAFALERVLASAGLDVAIADGRLHPDAAWAVRGDSGFRPELYLDATPRSRHVVVTGLPRAGVPGPS